MASGSRWWNSGPLQSDVGIEQKGSPSQTPAPRALKRRGRLAAATKAGQVCAVEAWRGADFAVTVLRETEDGGALQ